MLLIFASLAACSTRDDSASTAALAQDTTLARLDVRAQTLKQPLPDACSNVAPAAQPAAVDKQQAAALSRQAYEAELLGRVDEARALLRHASALDGTDELVAYHLGRTSEELGDRTSAVTAYCRYLTLTPTATMAGDARLRLARLSQPQALASTGSAASAVPTRRHSSSVAVRAPVRRTRVAEPRTVAVATAPQPSDADPAIHRTSDDGDVVAQPRPVPTASQPSIPSPTRRRGPTRVQGAGIGAITGAIIGAAAGRSVKGALIGAAAGGVLGTVVAGSSR